MLPVELVHYDAWAYRLQGGLEAAYPQTFWMVLQHAELGDGNPWRFDLAWDGGLLPAFRLIAVKLVLL